MRKSELFFIGRESDKTKGVKPVVFVLWVHSLYARGSGDRDVASCHRHQWNLPVGNGIDSHLQLTAIPAGSGV
jgi:hypothetical protein